jgi:hypothetical protein
MSLEALHGFMRGFLRSERGMIASVMPYYFNLFALVVNKEVIFLGAEESLI